MKKNFNKEISHEEKIEFYHKYNDEKFLATLRQTEDKCSKIGFRFLQIFFILAFVGGIFSLWLCLFMVPAMVVPMIMLGISYKINKKRIDNLTPNMTYKEFMKMFDNGEWKQIVQELNDQAANNKEDTPLNICPRPSMVKELKKQDCPYIDEDKALHPDNHDDFSDDLLK